MTISKTPKDYIDDFINTKTNENLNENSIDRYKRILKKLNIYLTDNNKTLGNLIQKDIVSFLDDEKDRKSRTKQNYLTILKTFFSFISDKENLLNKTNDTYFNYLFKDILIEVENKKLVSFNKEELKKILSYINNVFTASQSHKTNFNASTKTVSSSALKEQSNNLLASKLEKYQNALSIFILLNTGIRISELLSIKIKDIKEKKSSNVFSFEVLSENKLKRTLYVPYKIKSILELLNAHKVVHLAFPNNKYISIDVKSRDIILKKYIYGFIKKINKELHIDKTGVDIFRHTLAFRLIKNNTDLVTLQGILGHKNIVNTAVYASSDIVKEENALIDGFIE